MSSTLQHRRPITPALVLALVGVLLFGTPALADVRHGSSNPQHYAPVQGTVTGVSNTSLQVQTPAGGMTFSLNSITHVIRVVSGSLKDVRPNLHVDVHLIRGTTTVDSVRIDPASRPGSHTRHDMASVFGRATWQDDVRDWTSVRTAPNRGPADPRDQTSGTVVSVGSGSLTLRLFRGKIVTYTLAGSLSVTKLLTGTRDDLAMGEKVRVYHGRSGNCVEVDILSA